MSGSVEYRITHYDLVQGALEIQYIEEFFGEFPRKKTAAEIVRRLEGRAHLILLATAPLPDDPGSVVPVSFKVAHEIRMPETEPKLVDLMHRLSDNVQFSGRRVLYTWIGGTRRDWRGKGLFRSVDRLSCVRAAYSRRTLKSCRFGRSNSTFSWRSPPRSATATPSFRRSHVSPTASSSSSRGPSIARSTACSPTAGSPRATG